MSAVSVLTGRRLAVSSREVVADLETPISIFQKLAPAGPCFLLESAEGGDRVGRFSFIGLDPLGVAVFRRGSLTVYERPAGGWPQEAWWVERLTGDPFSTLRSWLYSFELPAAALAGEDAPPLLHGGVVGYWAYDCIRYLERLPGPPPDDLKLPEAVFLFPGTILALDHLRHALRVTALEREVGPEGRVAGAAARVEAVLARLAAGGTDTPGVRVPAGAGGGSGA
ncbi:MAG: hypothetical protein IRY95_10905, partial [Clostridia bacterium]|nr:hypothetical protein [Clostridia bacterium]